MNILAIDTSCDETSVSILKGDKLIKQEISSQIKSQKKWGGVVPMLARRKHVERIEFVIAKALYYSKRKLIIKQTSQLKSILETYKKKFRAPKEENTNGGKEQISYTVNLRKKKRKSYETEYKKHDVILENLIKISNPGIDLIAVTQGPGLSVALEIGLQAAKELSRSWDIPIVLVNHIEAHIWSSMLKSDVELSSLLYPALGIVLSGGHTELVLIESFGKYKIVGQTLDDSAGEAFDKFAVMLNLGYPGGPIVENLAKEVKRADLEKALESYPLPVPMKNSEDLNFSYSGLKTAALYLLQKKANGDTITLDKSEVIQFCASFQYSIVESIRLKLAKAIKKYRPKVLLSGGGVLSNNSVRKMIRDEAKKADITYLLPHKNFTGDNASMIGLVGYYKYLQDKNHVVTPDSLEKIDRSPTLSLDKIS